MRLGLTDLNPPFIMQVEFVKIKNEVKMASLIMFDYSFIVQFNKTTSKQRCFYEQNIISKYIKKLPVLYISYCY
jgi:hypothetical protein